MSSESYASFLQSMGHDVVQQGDLWWFDVQKHIYMSFPFHREVDARHLDRNAIFHQGAWVLRFPCPLPQGRQSYILLASNKDYDLSHLSGKARNQTRRGLEACTVEQVDFADLYETGILLNRETMERQGRTVPGGHDAYWKKYYQQAAKTKGAEAWAAFYKGQMVAFIIAFLLDGCANILIVRSSRAFLKYYPNNVLIYVYLRETLRRSDVDQVSIGLESLQPGLESLDHFKLGMGFSRKPIGQRIELNRILHLIMRGPLLRFTMSLVSRKSGDERYRKISGLLQWYDDQLIL